MLTISAIGSAGAGSDYYTQGSYYTESESALVVEGKLAEEFGITKDDINEESLEALLDGILPNGETLGRVENGERVHSAGLDMTFSAPKSVSILAYLGGDNELLKAHDTAVKEAFNYLSENLVGYREYNKHTEEQDFKQGGDIMGALFRHYDSRDHDPQMHTHCVIPNMIKGEDGKVRSLDPRMLYDSKLMLGAYYRASLSSKVAELGYDIESKENGLFEIKGVSEELRTAFSDRSETILKIMKETGASGTKEALKIQKDTRGTKENITYAELLSKGDNKLAKLGMTRGDISKLSNTLKHQPMQEKKLSNQELMDKSFTRVVNQLSERNSVFAENDFKADFFPLMKGQVTPQEAMKYLENKIEKGDLQTSMEHGKLKATKYMTTPQAIKLEKDTIALMEAGKGTQSKFMDKGILQEKLSSSTLNKGQKDAVKNILTSDDRFVTIQGYAGTGKTYMLNYAIQNLQAGGKNVIASATTNKAKEILSEETGLDGITLSSFLMQNSKLLSNEASKTEFEQAQSKYKDMVLIIDESSMIGTEQMHDLLKLSNKLDLSRIVLVGDSQQLQAVSAGNPFKQLQDNGISMAEMTDIQRQKNKQSLTAVESVLSGEIEKSFANIDVNNVDVKKTLSDALGEKGALFVNQEQQALVLADEAIKSYLNLPSEQYNAIVTTTNLQKDFVNLKLRTELQNHDILKGKEYTHQVLGQSSKTKEELKHAENYKAGDVLRLIKTPKENSAFQGMERETLLTVKKIDTKNNIITVSDGKNTMEFNPKIQQNSSHYSSHLTHTLKVQQGEQIMFTSRNSEHQLANKSKATITSIDKNNVSLKLLDGREITVKSTDKALKSIDYCYANTGHSLQGDTVDNIVSILPSSGKLTSQQSAYVHMSRARHNITVVTDNKDKLIESIKSNTGEKLLALDIDKYKNIVSQLEDYKEPSFKDYQLETKTSSLEVDVNWQEKKTPQGEIREQNKREHNFNQAVRKELLSIGLLKGRAKEISTLKLQGWNEKQKSFASNYQVGDAISFDFKGKDISSDIPEGTQLKIYDKDTKNNTLSVEYKQDKKDSKRKEIVKGILELNKVDKGVINVYKKESMTIQKGERILYKTEKDVTIPLTITSINHSNKMKGITTKGQEIYIPDKGNMVYNYQDKKMNLSTNREDKQISFIGNKVENLLQNKSENDRLLQVGIKNYVEEKTQGKDVLLLTRSHQDKYVSNLQIREKLSQVGYLKGAEILVNNDKLKLKEGEHLGLKKPYDLGKEQLHKSDEFKVEKIDQDKVYLSINNEKLTIVDKNHDLFKDMTYGYAKTHFEEQKGNKDIITNLHSDDVTKASSKQYLESLANSKSVLLVTNNNKELDKKLEVDLNKIKTIEKENKPEISTQSKAKSNDLEL